MQVSHQVLLVYYVMADLVAHATSLFLCVCVLASWLCSQTGSRRKFWLQACVKSVAVCVLGMSVGPAIVAGSTDVEE